MAEVIKKLIRGYKVIFDEWADHRTKDWFLVAKPYQGLLLLGIYLTFVLKWGPRWMRNRPAFKLDRVLIAYNAIQAVACVLLFKNSLRFWGWGGSYKWICQPVDHTNSEEGLFAANLVYNYYLLKIIDLLDTVFFVLRKKNNQVSFLHVYHHTGMVMLSWGAVTYHPGGHGISVGVINSFVHVGMYTYYMFSIVVPSIKNQIWIKKLVTQLQIIQFFLLVVHIGAIIFEPDCKYPRWTAALFLPQNLFMLVLFIDFYIKTYTRKDKKISLNNRNENNDGNEKDFKHTYDNEASNGKYMKNGFKKENGHKRIERFVNNYYNNSDLTERKINRS